MDRLPDLTEQLQKSYAARAREKSDACCRARATARERETKYPALSQSYLLSSFSKCRVGSTASRRVSPRSERVGGVAAIPEADEVLALATPTGDHVAETPGGGRDPAAVSAWAPICANCLSTASSGVTTLASTAVPPSRRTAVRPCRRPTADVQYV